METNEKIAEIVNKQLLLKKRKKEILLITLTIENERKIEIIFRHPHFCTLIAYRFACNKNQILNQERSFNDAYRIIYNGKNFIDGLPILESYLQNGVKEIDYKMIMPKKVGSEDGNYFFV